MGDLADRGGPLFPDPFVEPQSVAWVPGRCRGDLPHLEKPGCSYFVTFCLHDARLRRQRIESGRADAVTAACEPVESESSRVLQDPRLAAVVEDALICFQSRRYLLSAWCIMPSHVHAVVTPLPEWTLPRVLHSWKSFSAHRINSILGRTGPVWQEETFDHVIRAWDSFLEFVAYTERNPLAAGLVQNMEEWPFSSGRFRDERE